MALLRGSAKCAVPCARGRAESPMSGWLMPRQRLQLYLLNADAYCVLRPDRSLKDLVPGRASRLRRWAHSAAPKDTFFRRL